MTVLRHDTPVKDTISQLGVNFRTAGYGRPTPDMKRQMIAQLRKAPLSSRGLLSRPLATAVTALASYAPGPLDLSYVCNSGDEALDFGLKLARGLHPERFVVVGLSGVDNGALVHGRSITAGRPLWPGQALTPRTVPGERVTELPGLIDETVAAVVISPVGPARPLTALDSRWWRELRERCSDTGALLIGDERASAPARLGHPYGFSALGINPDVMALGSQLSAGLVPVGAAVTSYELYRRVFGHRNGTVHGSTFGANPMASTAISAVLDPARIADLTTWCAARGERWERAWSALPDNNLVASTSVNGLYASVAFTTPNAATEAKRLLEEELIYPSQPAGGNVLTFTPDLTIDDEIFDIAVQSVAQTISRVDSSQVEREDR